MLKVDLFAGEKTDNNKQQAKTTHDFFLPFAEDRNFILTALNPTTYDNKACCCALLLRDVRGKNIDDCPKKIHSLFQHVPLRQAFQARW
jgi:hypothetical protein